ncbi:hypothetical protein Bbelb_440690 [Branchiostoma belcheri]|nr:hypothetical protein Bbelb_440690 [Branchiostoma belcheri]
MAVLEHVHRRFSVKLTCRTKGRPGDTKSTAEVAWVPSSVVSARSTQATADERTTVNMGPTTPGIPPAKQNYRSEKSLQTPTPVDPPQVTWLKGTTTQRPRQSLTAVVFTGDKHEGYLDRVKDDGLIPAAAPEEMKGKGDELTRPLRS